MKKLLPLLYKGSRDYLHGSDFFNSLMKLAEENTGDSDSYVERLTFRGYACKLCELIDIKPIDQGKVIGQVRYMTPVDSNKINFWLVETDKLVTNRYEFDENVVLLNSNLNEEKRSIILPNRSIYTPIEDVIILTKRLNYAISPINNGSWLFGQLDLLEPLIDNYNSLEIKMKNLIEGKFSINEILIDGRMIGSIRFIMGVE